MTLPNGEDTEGEDTTGADANGADAASGFGGAAADPKGDAVSGAGDVSSPTGQDDSASDKQYKLPDDLLGEDGALDSEKVTEHLKANAEATAARTEKYGEVPEGDYDLTIDVEGEDGTKLEIDPENAILKDLLPTLKDMGLGQKGVTQLLTGYAKAATGDAQAIADSASKAVIEAQQERVNAEIASLGDQGNARIDATTAILTELTDAETANALMNDVRSKAAFEALEKIVERANGGGSEDPIPNGSADKTIAPENVLYGKD